MNGKGSRAIRAFVVSATSPQAGECARVGGRVARGLKIHGSHST